MFPLIIGALVIVALLVSSSSEDIVVRPVEPVEPIGGGGGGGGSIPPKMEDTIPPKQTTYTVVSGDTASKIGVKFGKGGVYGELFAANPSKAIVRVYMNNDVGHEGKFFTTPDVDQVWSIGNKPTYMGRNFARLDIGEILKLPASWGLPVGSR